jgi:chromosome segregation ATPase
LESRFFESAAIDADTDPAWPCQLLRLNRRHAALQRELDSRARLLLEKRAEICRQSERIAQLEPQLTQLHAENNSLRHELQAAGEISSALGQNIANSSAQLETAQAQIRALEARQLELDDELGAKKTLIQALTKGRAQQDQLFAELAAERDVLRESVAAAQLRITECEAQLAAKETRAALTDAEFQKIEGQMDIIKAMVFREHVR